MKIVIVGAGALGTYFGLRMREIGHNITFLVREGRANTINKHGLKVISPFGDLTWDKPNYVLDASDIDECDLVFLGVKGYHLDGVSEQLHKLAQKGATVLPVLNGIEHISSLKDIFGEDRVLGGLAFIIATLNEEGHVIHLGDQHTFTYGVLNQKQGSPASKVSQALNDSAEKVNLNLVQSNQIKEEMWKKYVFISAFSGVTTSSRLPIGEIRRTPETLKLGKTIIEEMVTLAKAHGVTIDNGVDEAFSKLHSFPDEATSSMHQDIKNKRPLEVDALFGAALRMAKSKDIELPHVETIFALLKPYENGQ